MALDIARRLKNIQCEEPLAEAVSGRFNPHVHVEYDWNLRLDELDESDDELDDKEKLSLPAFAPSQRGQRLSYGAFANPVYITSSDTPPSPGPDATGPSSAVRGQGKGHASGPPTSLPLTSQSSGGGGGGSSTLKKRPPPPPPGHKRTLSDPPSPILQGPPGKGSEMTPPPGNRTSPADKFEGIQQQP
eukprot:superscaffoldBa00013438_g26013